MMPNNAVGPLAAVVVFGVQFASLIAGSALHDGGYRWWWVPPVAWVALVIACLALIVALAHGHGGRDAR